jgi:hypothetical protein
MRTKPTPIELTVERTRLKGKGKVAAAVIVYLLPLEGMACDS